MSLREETAWRIWGSSSPERIAGLPALVAVDVRSSLMKIIVLSPLILTYAISVDWRSGLEARGKLSRRGVEMQLIRIVLLVGSMLLIGLLILLVL